MKAGVKQIRMLQKPPAIPARKQQKDWNSRFYLEKIPEYNALEDQYCVNYTESVKRYGRPTPAGKSKAHAILAPGGIRAIKRQPSIEKVLERELTSQENRMPSVKSKENISPEKAGPSGRKKKGNKLTNETTIASLEEEIRLLWRNHNVDKHFADAFMASISSLKPSMYIQFLAKEIENLYNSKAVVQELLLAIQTRETTIKDITQMNQYISSSAVTQETVENAIRMLEGLRLISLAVVEAVVHFREQLRSAYYMAGEEAKVEEVARFPCMVSGENYLVKMKTDTTFLAKSELAKLFNFCLKCDPFLVSAATPYPVAKGASKRNQLKALKAQTNQPMLALPVLPELSKRIKAAEITIMEEAIHLKAWGTPGKDTNIEEGKELKTPRQVDKVQAQIIDSKKSLHHSEEKLAVEKHSVEKHNAEKQKESSARGKAELMPLQTSVKDIGAFLRKYEELVEPNVLKSYCPLSDLPERTFSGYEPYWLCYTTSTNLPDDIQSFMQGKDTGSIKGLAVFYLDPSAKLRPRAEILHVSLRNDEGKIDGLLTLLANYIWRNVFCDEIRVGLAHLQEADAKLVPYEPLKNSFQEQKFRWKTLTNDEKGNRILVLGVNRPETQLFNNPRAIDLNKDHITFKHSAVFSTGLKKKGKVTEKHGDPHLSIACCSYIETFMILKKGGQVSSLSAIELPSSEDADLLRNCLLTIDNTQKSELPATKGLATQDLKEVEEMLKQQDIKIPEGCFTETAESYNVGVQSLALKWNNYESTSFKGHNYVRIRGNFLLSDQPNYTIVLLSSDDEGIGVILVVPKEEGIEELKSWEKVSAALAKLESNEGSRYRECWIPGFSVNYNNRKLPSYIAHTSIGGKSVLQGCECSECSVYCPKPHGCSLAVEDTSNALIVDKSFYFGLVHEKLQDELKIPLIYTFVPQEAWTKADF